MKILKLRLLVPSNTPPDRIEKHIAHIHKLHHPRGEVPASKRVVPVRWENGHTLAHYIKRQTRLYADASIEKLLDPEDRKEWKLKWQRIISPYSMVAPPLYFLADETTHRQK